MSADQTSGWAQVAVVRAVPNAFRARSLNGSATPMVGAWRDRLVTVVPVMPVPVRVDPGIPGCALAAPVMAVDGMVEPALVVPGKVVEKAPPGMPAVSRFAVRQAVPGMRFVQAVGASAPTGIAPPAVLLPVIGPTEPAAAQIARSLAIGPSSEIGPSSGIGPDLRVGLRMQPRRSAVPLSAVPLTGDPSIAVLAAVPLAVPLGALVPPVLGPAGRMGLGPIVAILFPPALTAAEIGQAPGR